MNNMSNVKVGDKVILNSEFNRRTICMVRRTTPNYFELVDVNGRYRKRDGHRPGTHRFRTSWVAPYSDGEAKGIAAQARRDKVFNRLMAVDWSLQPTEKLEAAWKAIQPPVVRSSP